MAFGIQHLWRKEYNIYGVEYNIYGMSSESNYESILHYTVLPFFLIIIDGLKGENED